MFSQNLGEKFVVRPEVASPCIVDVGEKVGKASPTVFTCRGGGGVRLESKNDSKDF